LARSGNIYMVNIDSKRERIPASVACTITLRSICVSFAEASDRELSDKPSNTQRGSRMRESRTSRFVRGNRIAICVLNATPISPPNLLPTGCEAFHSGNRIATRTTRPMHSTSFRYLQRLVSAGDRGWGIKVSHSESLSNSHQPQA
jgi:hypothetical protein